MVVVEGRAPPRSNDAIKYRVGGWRRVGVHWIARLRGVCLCRRCEQLHTCICQAVRHGLEGWMRASRQDDDQSGKLNF